MAISYVSGASAAAATVAMPTHAAGDLIVAFAFRDGSVTNPALPAGWSDVGQPDGVNLCSFRVGCKVAASSSETTGTWTGATGVTVGVYRKTSTESWLPPVLSYQNGTGTTIDYSSNTTFGVEPNPPQTNTTKWYARFGGARAATNLTTNTPSGWTPRSGTATETRLMDTNGNVGTTTLPAAVGGNTQAVTGSGGWATAVITLEAWDGTGVVCVARGAMVPALWTSPSGLLGPIPSHQPGDVFILHALRTASTTPPSLPAGWTDLGSTGANGISSRIGYKVATTSSETIGTWSNADTLTLGIYRSVTGYFVTPAAGGFLSGSSGTADLSTPLVPVNSSRNRYVRFVGMAPSWPTDPAGWSMYLAAVSTAGTNERWNALFDSNGVVRVPADEVGDVSMPLSASGAWLTNTIRLAACVHRPAAATFQGQWQAPAGTLLRMISTGAVPSGSWKVALVSSSSNISSSTTAWAGVTGELPTANGYTAGGKSVTLSSWQSGVAAPMWFTNNPVWIATGGGLAARYAVLYEVGGDVAAYVLLNAAGPAPADLTASAGNPLEVYGDPVFTLV